MARVPMGVGYWDDGWLPLPRPQDLVCPGWRSDDRDRIVAYLREGVVVRRAFGSSACRFMDCRLSLGSADLTDGLWMWPERLEHYVTDHAVQLPEVFVETMEGNGWRVPTVDGAETARALLSVPNTIPTYFAISFRWIQWSKQVSR